MAIAPCQLFFIFGGRMDEREELNRAIANFKASLWQERYRLLVVFFVIVSFLAGAAIEHYLPKMLERLW